ncbi:MAG: type II secretion system protein GspD, partial [Pseudanabaena sp.]
MRLPSATFTKLPVTLKNLITKSYRLNQITVGEASAYLIGLGASRVVTRQRPIPGVQTAQIGSAAQAIVNIPTEAVPTLETVSIPVDSGATPLLKGLQVIAEERGNSLTLIGSPRQVEFAEAQLARLDIRKRQVIVNVRVLEVNLSRNQSVGGGLTTTGSNPVITQGAGVPTTFLNSLGITFNTGSPLSMPGSVIFSLTTAIQSGNGKILTDPNLTVQESETATISLTDQIINNITSTANPAGSGSAVSTNATLGDVGLTLSINIERIDDNGFVNLSVSPTISSPGATLTFGTPPNVIRAIKKRVLNSGKIRLRDNQTLVLSGIIQDADSESVSKVPLLGDLPII